MSATDQLDLFGVSPMPTPAQLSTFAAPDLSPEPCGCPHARRCERYVAHALGQIDIITGKIAAPPPCWEQEFRNG